MIFFIGFCFPWNQHPLATSNLICPMIKGWTGKYRGCFFGIQHTRCFTGEERHIKVWVRLLEMDTTFNSSRGVRSRVYLGMSAHFWPGVQGVRAKGQRLPSSLPHVRLPLWAKLWLIFYYRCDNTLLSWHISLTATVAFSWSLHPQLVVARHTMSTPCIFLYWMNESENHSGEVNKRLIRGIRLESGGRALPANPPLSILLYSLTVYSRTSSFSLGPPAQDPPHLPSADEKKPCLWEQ